METNPKYKLPTNHILAVGGPWTWAAKLPCTPLKAFFDLQVPVTEGLRTSVGLELHP